MSHKVEEKSSSFVSLEEIGQDKKSQCALHMTSLCSQRRSAWKMRTKGNCDGAETEIFARCWLTVLVVVAGELSVIGDGNRIPKSMLHIARCLMSRLICVGRTKDVHQCYALNTSGDKDRIHILSSLL